MRKAAVAVALLGALTALTGVGRGSAAFGQSYIFEGGERFFRVESEPGRTRKGAPVVSGYVYNQYGSTAANVRVLVETLDASGQTVDRQIHQLPGTVPGDGRAYFQFKVPSATSYRVRVSSWEWLRGGAS
jgi:hypothetical protein